MQLTVILVEPKHPEHVGAAARALKTMGFNHLRLVGEPLHEAKAATILAHGAGDILNAASCHDSLAQAVSDQDFIIGTTAKLRHHRRYCFEPQALAQNLAAKQGSVQHCALVFGREDRGLANDEIALCDALTRVPLAADYPSLNLAQAVMVYAYALSGLAAAEKPARRAPDQYRSLVPKLERLLTSAGIESSEKTYKWALERLAQGSTEDIKFLHFICEKLLNR